jgi:hypothetical protein
MESPGNPGKGDDDDHLLGNAAMMEASRSRESSVNRPLSHQALDLDGLISAPHRHFVVCAHHKLPKQGRAGVIIRIQVYWAQWADGYTHPKYDANVTPRVVPRYS